MTIEFPPAPGQPVHTEPFGPGQKQPPAYPADLISSSAVEQLTVASANFSTLPQLSLATFYGKVSMAQVLQKIQEIISALTDPLKSKELWRFTDDQATALRELLNKAYTFQSLQEQLVQLGLDAKRNAVNVAVANYNAAVSANVDVQAAQNALSIALSNYNTAQDTYQAALADYQGHLDTFKTAQDNYQSAVDAWNQALQDYQDGGPLGDLEAARAVYEAAQSDYANAKATFDSQQTDFDNATAVFTAAKGDLLQARADYNAAIASISIPEQTALNDAIATWNNSVQAANSLIEQINDVRTTLLGESPLPFPPFVDPVNGIPPYNLPPAGPNTLRDDAQTKVNSFNASVTAISTLISSANLRIEAINAGGSVTLDLIDPALATSIGNLPTIDVNLPFLTLPPVLSSVNLTYVTPPPEDGVIIILTPQIDAIERISEFRTQNVRFDEDTATGTPAARDKNLLIGGAGASTAMSTINPTEGLSSPFLERQLSRQAFESFYNFYGVPQASALVDQIGALYDRIANLAGLVSAGTGQQILGNAGISGPAGAAAINAATALAFIRQLHTMASSPQLKESIARIVYAEPSLSGLSVEEKASLIDDIAREVGASLLKDGLLQVAQNLGMPGLVPQILAKLAGMTSEDVLASFQSQLYLEVLFSQELATAFNLPQSQIEEIVQEAYEQQRQDVIQFITDQIAKLNETSADVERSVRQARDDAESRLESERIRVEDLQKKAFRDALLQALIDAEVDPAKARIIADRARIDSQNAVRAQLIRNGIDETVSVQAASVAVGAYQNKDGFYNPLGAFLLQHVGTNTELAAFFKLQTINQLSPVIGLTKAQAVAEEYSALIFSDATYATLNVIQTNEEQLLRLDNYQKDKRLYEDYRDATEMYINPTLAAESPMRLGKTLLLTGMVGGLSSQGVLTGDTELGNLAGRFDRPIAG